MLPFTGRIININKKFTKYKIGTKTEVDMEWNHSKQQQQHLANSIINNNVNSNNLSFNQNLNDHFLQGKLKGKSILFYM
jgi:mRNA-degrading endonuclease YafQ of YafQ-DinJ toxin-antitoxin module